MSEIQALDNGPLIVKGTDVVVKDGEGNTIDTSGKDTVALCRCGHSAKKPFCDGAHAGNFDSQVRG